MVAYGLSDVVRPAERGGQHHPVSTAPPWEENAPLRLYDHNKSHAGTTLGSSCLELKLMNFLWGGLRRETV